MSASRGSGAGEPIESLLGAIPFIRRTLAHRGVLADDMDDVVSTVLLGAVSSAARYDPSPDKTPDSAFQSWLFGICRNVASRYRENRAAAGARLATLDVGALGDGAPSAEQVLGARERLAQVQAALARLPAHVREAFTRHDVDGESIAVVAEALAASPSTVYKHVVRARRAIAAALRRADAHDRRYARTAPRRRAAAAAAERRRTLRESLESAASALETAARALRVAMGEFEAA